MIRKSRSKAKKRSRKVAKKAGRKTAKKKSRAPAKRRATAKTIKRPSVASMRKLAPEQPLSYRVTNESISAMNRPAEPASTDLVESLRLARPKEPGQA